MIRVRSEFDPMKTLCAAASAEYAAESKHNRSDDQHQGVRHRSQAWRKVIDRCQKDDGDDFVVTIYLIFVTVEKNLPCIETSILHITDCHVEKALHMRNVKKI